jgi:hypothetical protein
MASQQILSRHFLSKELKKLKPDKYKKFQWWRRYVSRNTLPKKTPLYEKIVHGDYDASTYLYQADHEMHLLSDKLQNVKHPDEAHDIKNLFMERRRRLLIDYEKEEANIMRELKSDFVKTFKIDRKLLETIMETFDGTLVELYNHIKNKSYDSSRLNY